MYRQCLYGRQVVSNIDICSALNVRSQPLAAEDEIHLHVSVEPGSMPSPRFMSKRINEHEYVIGWPDGIRYHIDLESNRIDVLTEDLSVFFDTFINVPFSIFFLLQGKALLHAGAVVHSDRLLAFSGMKGAGKSTLLYHLVRRGALFFSDDTLLAEWSQHGSNKVSCFGALSILKLHKNQVNASEQYYVSSQSKAYVPIDGPHLDSSSGSKEIDCLYFLVRRSPFLDYEEKEVQDRRARLLMLCNAVCGYGMLDGSLKSKVASSSVLQRLADSLAVRTLRLKDGLGSIDYNAERLLQGFASSDPQVTRL